MGGCRSLATKPKDMEYCNLIDGELSIAVIKKFNDTCLAKKCLKELFKLKQKDEVHKTLIKVINRIRKL